MLKNFGCRRRRPQSIPTPPTQPRIQLPAPPPTSIHPHRNPNCQPQHQPHGVPCHEPHRQVPSIELAHELASVKNKHCVLVETHLVCPTANPAVIPPPTGPNLRLHTPPRNLRCHERPVNRETHLRRLTSPREEPATAKILSRFGKTKTGRPWIPTLNPTPPVTDLTPSLVPTPTTTDPVRRRA